jgi:uncharacterized protein DUF2877
MIATSHSGSDLLGALLFGPHLTGAAYGRRHVRFGDYVVAITKPGSPRMPNGIECAVRVRSRDELGIGRGQLVVGPKIIDAGPEWDPIPAAVDRQGVLPAGAVPLVQLVPIRQTPNADDVLAGYLAGLVLLHDQRDRALRIATAAAGRTDPLQATLLRHAARGEVPEPVHTLLATGDANCLLAFEGPSGQSWVRGLLSAGYPVRAVLPKAATRGPDGLSTPRRTALRAT